MLVTILLASSENAWTGLQVVPANSLTLFNLAIDFTGTKGCAQPSDMLVSREGLLGLLGSQACNSKERSKVFSLGQMNGAKDGKPKS